MGANSVPLSWWLYFNLFIAVMLVLDLKVFHRRTHVIQMREALRWTSFWVSLALLFAGGLWLLRPRILAAGIHLGERPALEFLTAYLIEESLSVDNLFVFLIIFKYFRVPQQYQHKVLFWGILGAIVMRAAFILLGTAAIHRFHWTIYIFGAFLVYTGIRLALEREKEIHPEKNVILRLVRRWAPVTPDFHNGHFIVRIGGRAMITPLLVVVLVLETTDVVFAVDSIPAVLAITPNPFIAYTSNLFAVLGLRSIFFALAGLMGMFHHLGRGLSFILVFIGVKMLISRYYHVPIGWALGVVVATLALSVLASVLFPRRDPGAPP
ncbi:MAG: TerC family protein, partial [Candidatus Eisenbacteria bacterium]